MDIFFKDGVSKFLAQVHMRPKAHPVCLKAQRFVVILSAVMITYNIYIVIRETGQFSSKGIINDFIGNLNRLTVSRRFTEQAV